MPAAPTGLTPTAPDNPRPRNWRWLWLPLMAPVMWGLFQLVCWADRLFAWEYSPEYDPPTRVDFIRAAVVFWGALAVPLLTGLAAAAVAFRRRASARWPALEAAILAVPYSAFVAEAVRSVWKSPGNDQLIWGALALPQFLAGGAIVMLLLNTGASLRGRQWGKATLSVFLAAAGLLYLFWFYGFILYLDT